MAVAAAAAADDDDSISYYTQIHFVFYCRAARNLLR